MKKILIYEAESNQALAVSKFLKKYSEYYIVGCIEKTKRFNKINYDEIIVSRFLDIDPFKYDFVLPMGANSSYDITQNYKELHYCNGIRFLDKNLIVYDKPAMLKIAKHAGIPIPKTYYQTEDIVSFPVFYKENFERGAGTLGIAYHLEGIPSEENLIYQEYIDTPSTYGIGFLAKDGKVITSTIHKEVISQPIDGGSSVVIETFFDEKLIKYTNILVEKLDYQGWGLAEFKYCDKRDDFIFMEINGKFWASVEFMLRNNPLFLFNLLDIEYKAIETKRLLFINRLATYNFKDFIRNMGYIFISNTIMERSLAYQLTRKLIPNRVVYFLKKLLK